LREDFLIPQHVPLFTRDVTEYASALLSSQNDDDSNTTSPSPLRFMSLPSTGGRLNVATHAYYFEGGLSERESYWNDNGDGTGCDGNGDKWGPFVETTTRPLVESQKSMLFVEAGLVRDAELPGLMMAAPPHDNGGGGNDCILEIRRYNLKLGYDTVPKFLELYTKGLPSKLYAKGTDPTTTLVTLLYSEVGRLNEVIEVWRHGNGVAAMEQSRAAARQAYEWKIAIKEIADLAIEFSATIHKPLYFLRLGEEGDICYLRLGTVNNHAHDLHEVSYGTRYDMFLN